MSGLGSRVSNRVRSWTLAVCTSPTGTHEPSLRCAATHTLLGKPSPSQLNVLWSTSVPSLPGCPVAAQGARPACSGEWEEVMGGKSDTLHCRTGGELEGGREDDWLGAGD